MFYLSLKYFLYQSTGFLAGGGIGDESDGEGKLPIPDILASLTKEQRKELAALRVDEKKWKREDRRKKRKKKRKSRRDGSSDESSDEDYDRKGKQHRHKNRSHKHRKRSQSDTHRSDRGHHRKHHHSDSTSSCTSSELDHAATASESRDVSSRKKLEGSDDSNVQRAAVHERHYRSHRSSRTKDRDRDRERKVARDTVLDEVYENFKRQRKKDH